LRPIRSTEFILTPDLGAEIDAIAELVRGGRRSDLRRSLVAYHRRRDRQVGEIVAALVAPSSQTPHAP
jgi:hypothetical protein